MQVSWTVFCEMHPEKQIVAWESRYVYHSEINRLKLLVQYQPTNKYITQMSILGAFCKFTQESVFLLFQLAYI